MKGESQTALLREILAVLRGMRADMRQRETSPAAHELICELEEHFGNDGTFTVNGLLRYAAESPHDPLSMAISRIVDMNASDRSRSTQLGRFLSNHPQIEITPRKIDNSSVYRVGTSTEHVPDVPDNAE